MRPNVPELLAKLTALLNLLQGLRHLDLGLLEERLTLLSGELGHLELSDLKLLSDRLLNLDPNALATLLPALEGLLLDLHHRSSLLSPA